MKDLFTASDMGITLKPIPWEKYDDYRLEVIFGAYKWDPQVYDTNTISKNILFLSPETADLLGNLAERLAAETMLTEEALSENHKLAARLGIPRSILRGLKLIKGYRRENHVRLMRFDFHPTDNGWAVSEVNSDVPAGMAEASILPAIALKYGAGGTEGGDVVKSICEAYAPLVPANGRIAFVHATAFVEDTQMMRCLASAFERRGFEAVYAAPNQIGRQGDRAVSLVSGTEGGIDGIVRYFPVEWLRNYSGFYKWKGYFTSALPSCNHPIALYSQSKRVPLVWAQLGVPCPTWRELLPETVEPRSVKRMDKGFIYKPAMGRVGSGITIPEALTAKEYAKYTKAARRFPKHWVAQRRFNSIPLMDGQGEEYHLCLGVFTVNGKRAGFYARTSRLPRVDEKAIDTPVLIDKETEFSSRL